MESTTPLEARFRTLFDAVYEPLVRFVRRRAPADVVDDVVADALLVAWRRLDEIPPGAELAWCFGVARRCLANQRRSESRRLGLVERLGAQVPATAYAAMAGGEDGEDDAVRAAMARLSDDDRAVLELWAWEELAPREIGTVLGITANAASIRLHRAKKRMKSLLTDGKTTADAGHPAGGRERKPR